SRRNVQAQRLPVIAIIKRNVNRAFSSGEQKTFALRILAYRIHVFGLRNTIRDLGPSCAGVAGAKDVRPQIIEPQSIDRSVRHIFVVVARFDNRDFPEGLELRWCDVFPSLAAIAREMNEAIVSPRPDAVDTLI